MLLVGLNFKTGNIVIRVIDNVIPVSYQEELKSAMLSNNFSWFYINDITSFNSEYNNNAPAFCHQLVINESINSNFWHVVSCIPHIVAQQTNITFKKVVQARSFMQLSLNPKNIKDKIDSLHIDSDKPHYAVIYYVVDSDGDTIITSKKYDGIKGKEDSLKVKDFEIIKTVTPKQGRAVIFDGAYYHTAQQPENSSVRCIINFNLN